MAEEKRSWTMEELDELPEFQDAEPDEDEEYDDYDGEDDSEIEDEIPETNEPVEMKILDFDDILDVDDIGEETLYVPEWKGAVVFKGLTKNEFDHIRRMSRNPKNKGRSNAVLEREILIAGLVKPRLDIARYNRLQEKSSGVIIRLTNRIMDKSGLSELAEENREKRFPRKR